MMLISICSNWAATVGRCLHLHRRGWNPSTILGISTMTVSKITIWTKYASSPEEFLPDRL
jgi:hypothetical protein